MYLSPCNLAHWETNEVLLASEENFVREQLTGVEKELARIDLGLANAPINLHELQEQREIHSAIRRIFRAALATHKRLPPDILLEIFLRYGSTDVMLPPVPEDFSIHWTLTRVCSFWRNLILTTPSFWVRVHVSQFNPHYRRLYQEVIDRSGSLLIALHCPRYGITSRNDLSYVIYPYSQRIKSLCLTLHDFASKEFLARPGGSFDSLENIDLSYYHARGPAFPPAKSTIFQGARSLRTIRFQPINMLPGHFALDNICLPWAQLTQVFLWDVSSPVSTAHLVLSQCTSIMSCGLTIVPDGSHPPPLQFDKVVVPTLSDLDLGCTLNTSLDFLRPLVMPSLEELLFYDPSSWPGPALLGFIRRSHCVFRQWQSHTKIPLDDLELLLPELPSVTSIMINPENGIPTSIIDLILEGNLLPRVEHFTCSVAFENIESLLNMLNTRWLNVDPGASGGNITSATIHILDDQNIDIDVGTHAEELQAHYESERRAISFEVGEI